MLVAAFFTAMFLAGRQAKKENVDPGIILNIAFPGFILGIAGARIFYVIENFAYYLKNPLEIIMLQHGGLSWFGGLIFGVAAAAVYLKIKKIPFYPTLDLFAPFIALAQAIGRVGCLLNGCCFGRIDAPVPVQAVSSLLLIVIFIILRFIQDKPHKEGVVFFSYLILYSLKRFFIEFYREDNPVVFSGLTLFQLLSILLFVFATIKIFSIKKSR